jgi:hypothetical protein
VTVAEVVPGISKNAFLCSGVVVALPIKSMVMQELITQGGHPGCQGANGETGQTVAIDHFGSSS